MGSVGELGGGPVPAVRIHRVGDGLRTLLPAGTAAALASVSVAICPLACRCLLDCYG
jgi:hypothetical protein